VDARSENFPFMSPVEKPRVPFSTRKPRTPCSVRAHTTATSAIEPFVIQRFVPFRIQLPPRRSARVRMPAM
jgi:hypothetical protein